MRWRVVDVSKRLSFNEIHDFVIRRVDDRGEVASVWRAEDARLIAAAPVLLEQCEIVYRSLVAVSNSGSGDGILRDEEFDALRAAIIEAGGSIDP